MRSLRWLIPALVLAALACAPGAQAQRAQPRIIAGTDVAISTYPFQVALYLSNSFRCGGSFLDSTTVVTAAHCVTVQTTGQQHTPLAGPFSVGFGSDVRSAQQRVAVSTFDVPSQYTASVLTRDESYDVAILHLATAVDLTGPDAKAIPLANPSQPKDAGSAVVTGWGNTTEGGSSSQTLKGTRVPLRTDSVCTGVYPGDYVAARSVCAGGGSLPLNNPDTCQGDSGGPLVVDLDDTAAANFVLLGLTSFGDGCGRRDTPGVYVHTQGTGIASFLAGSGTVSSTFTSGNTEAGTPGAKAGTSPPGSGSSTPPVTTAPTTPITAPGVATRDTTRPTAKITKLSCTRKRICSFRVSAADAGGTVRAFAASLSRPVRACRRQGSFRYCRTNTRRKTLRPKRVNGGFTFTATLTKATYKLTAVATDAAGNRSAKLTRTFRVR